MLQSFDVEYGHANLARASFGQYRFASGKASAVVQFHDDLAGSEFGETGIWIDGLTEFTRQREDSGIGVLGPFDLFESEPAALNAARDRIRQAELAA